MASKHHAGCFGVGRWCRLEDGVGTTRRLGRVNMAWLLSLGRSGLRRRFRPLGRGFRRGGAPGRVFGDVGRIFDRSLSHLCGCSGPLLCDRPVRNDRQPPSGYGEHRNRTSPLRDGALGNPCDLAPHSDYVLPPSALLWRTDNPFQGNVLFDTLRSQLAGGGFRSRILRAKRILRSDPRSQERLCCAIPCRVAWYSPASVSSFSRPPSSTDRIQLEIESTPLGTGPAAMVSEDHSQQALP
jgi:hypothetical protein